MKDLPEDVVKAALALPPEGRAALAGWLLDSLEDADEDAQAAWSAEIARRIDEVDQGVVSPVSWAEARRKIVG